MSSVLPAVRLDPASFGNTKVWDLGGVFTQNGLYVLVGFN